MPLTFKALLLDMDGVLWRGETLIQANIEPVRKWIKEGGKAAFLTNNSTKSRIFYVKKLNNLGIKVSVKEIITSAWVASLWLKERGIKRVFVIGEDGLKSEIEGQGISVVWNPDVILNGGERVEALVIGMDREINYRKLWAGLVALDKGATFLATNLDPNYPTSSGRAPGGGSLVRALETASERSPDVVIGKPEPFLFKHALRVLSVRNEDALVVGDRLSTDILGAKRTGIKSLLVLTGISRAEEIGDVKPDFVAGDLYTFFVREGE
jgi:4-nitrophenyl phosphatase